MASQHPADTAPPRNRVLVILGILGMLAVLAAVGVWAYLTFSGHDTTGLEGTWHDKNDRRHSYEFQSNGDLATWSGSKEWWNRIGWSASWRRDGNHITIRTDRNWDLEGTLDGAVIRGKMLMRDEHGEVVNTAEVVWQKE